MLASHLGSPCQSFEKSLGLNDNGMTDTGPIGLRMKLPEFGATRKKAVLESQSNRLIGHHMLYLGSPFQFKNVLYPGFHKVSFHIRRRRKIGNDGARGAQGLHALGTGQDLKNPLTVSLYPANMPVHFTRIGVRF